MASPPLPWPQEAAEEKTQAVAQLERIRTECMALSDILVHAAPRHSLNYIAIGLLDAGKTGMRVLDKRFEEIKRWPDKANHARMLTVMSCQKATVVADRIMKITQAGDEKYSRTVLQEEAFKLLKQVQEALQAIEELE